MSTNNPALEPTWQGGPPDFVELASPKVVIEGVDDRLMNFAHFLGAMSKGLFGCPTIITSGKDSIHVAGSKHMQGKAIDIRTKDKTPDAVALLLHIIHFSGDTQGITCFDETALGAEAHFHLEVA